VNAPKGLPRRTRWLWNHPWWRAARVSPALRRALDKRGMITPHFSWDEMRGTDGTPVPVNLRPNSVRHAWKLEQLRHALASAARRRGLIFTGISIDGPYRTPAHNRAVGGAANSRHTYGDASDHFVGQVQRWQNETGLSRGQILSLCERIYARGGVGNEGTGTLHLDSRGYRARFVTWVASR
jgi:hypothetical protein